MISPELVKEFQEAVKEEGGEELTFSQASVILHDLVGYFDTLGRVYYQMQTRE